MFKDKLMGSFKWGESPLSENFRVNSVNGYGFLNVTKFNLTRVTNFNSYQCKKTHTSVLVWSATSFVADSQVSVDRFLGSNLDAREQA